MARRPPLSVLVVLILIAGSLAACGGPGEPTPTPTAEPPQAAASGPVRANPGSGDGMEEVPFILGERIFKEAAAEGVGCQYCHGPDGRGNVGPNIRGKRPGDIGFALDTVDAMQFIHLNQEKVEAVSVYLQWLATQP